MVKVNNKGDVSDAIDEVFRHFDKPVTTASKFYSFLYLADVKGIDEIDFDLFKLQNELTDAFINYTVYAVTRELGRKSRKLLINTVGMRDIAGGTFSRRTNKIYKKSDLEENGVNPRRLLSFAEGRLREELEAQMPDTKPRLAYNIVTDGRFGIPRGSKKVGIGREMKKVEERYNAMSEPYQYLTAAKALFELDYSAIDISSEYPSWPSGESGWNTNYGGESWGAVCSTAKQSQDLSDKAFVDIMFSVEHNNGNFLNKIPELDDKELTVLQQFFPKLNSRRNGKNYIYNNILPGVLDAAKSENIRPLYKIASNSASALRRRGIDESLFPPGEPVAGSSGAFGQEPDGEIR